MKWAINPLLPHVGSATCIDFFTTNTVIITLCLVPRFKLGCLPAWTNSLISQVLAFTRPEFHILSFQAIKFSPICSELPWTLREPDTEKNNQNRNLKPNQLFVHNMDIWIVPRYTPFGHGHTHTYSLNQVMDWVWGVLRQFFSTIWLLWSTGHIWYVVFFQVAVQNFYIFELF